MQLELTDRTLDLDRGVVHTPDEVGLSPIECKLLRHLALRLGRPVPQEELLEAVWGYAESVQSRTVTVTVNRLRGKLETDATDPAHLKTERGSGYALHAAPRRDPGLHPIAPLTPCVGRDLELQRALDTLAEGRAIVVLGGPGMGKTRLCHEISERWPGPVAWFDLEPSQSLEEALGAIAQRVGVRRGSPGGRELAASLASRVDLLVVDGVEHLAPALAPILSEWMRETGLRLLVSSRVPVAVEGATPLELPPLPAEASRDVLQRLGGVTGDDAAALVERCEGIPLALSLEAASARSFGPTDGTGLDGSFARSWSLLDTAHRDALAACASFGGWFDVAHTEAVIGPAPLPRLHLLRTHGLLQRRQDRLRLLASLAPSVTSRAPEAVHAGQVRHLAHFAELADSTDAQIHSPRRVAALDALLDVRVELEAALRFGVEHDADAACRVFNTYRYALAVRVGEQPVAWARRIADVAPTTRAGLLARANTALILRDRQALGAVLDVPEAQDDPVVLAQVLVKLAVVDFVACEVDQTRDWCERGLELDAEPWMLSRFWLGLAKVATSEGRPHDAFRLIRKASETLADAIDPPLQIELAMSEGRVAVDRGELQRALGLFEQALAIGEAEGPYYTFTQRTNLARVQAMLGRTDDALAGYRRLHDDAVRLHHPVHPALSAVRAAGVLLDAGRAEAGAALREARATLPDHIAVDIDVMLATHELMWSIEHDDASGVQTALTRLAELDHPSGDAVGRSFHAIEAWTRGEPVPDGLVDHVAEKGHLELAWNLLALRVLDGDAAAEERLRKELPPQGYFDARAALRYARAVRAGGVGTLESPVDSVLLRLMRRRVE